MPDNPIVQKLKDKFPEQTIEVIEFRNEVTVLLKQEKFLDIMQFLRDDPELQNNFLADLTAVDWQPRNPRFDVVYQLRSLPKNTQLRVKIKVADMEEVPTVTEIWSTANWLEREVYDLFGIEFTGHPDMRRIVTPDHWEGHPLRKDYPLTGRNEPLYPANLEDAEGKT